MKTSKINTCFGLIYCAIAILLFPMNSYAQETGISPREQAKRVHAAKEIMEKANYCALVTLDTSGHPQVRIMDPLSPGEDLVVWLGTKKNSRKVNEIRNDPRVSLYYEAPDGNGYVVIKGDAKLTDAPEKIDTHWKDAWDEFYPDKYTTCMLIQVIPKRLEVVSYSHGIVGSSKTWAVPFVEF